MEASIASPAPSVPLHFAAAKAVVAGSAASTEGAVLQAAAGSERFEAEMRELNLRNARLGTVFVMVLVPLCSVLDWLAYPEQFWDFLILRLLCSAVCVPLLLALNRPLASRWHRAYPVALPLIPALAISVMIYLSRDASSGYYAGLCLCLVGTSFVFHWTFREIGLTVGLVMAFYLAATLPNLHFTGDLRSIGAFINNTLFMLLMCVVLYFGSRQHHAIRLREFVNRCKVEAQREELKSRHDKLSATLQQLHDTEAQLTQSEKLASIGRLSAGIVHEINNPLNFVKTAIFVLRKKLKILPPDATAGVDEIIVDIGDGVDRVAAIVSDLKTFAHPETRSCCAVSLQQAASKALRLMAKEVKDRQVKLSCEIPADAFALGDENHIIQILINLLHNSLDAAADNPAPEIQVSANVAEDCVTLMVRDNGSGISEENLPRIFDPFFTTKDVGQGMGLGLSLCYRMMQQMGGAIAARSRPGACTEFVLRFPIASSAE